TVAEQVDAGEARRAVCERALAVDAPLARNRECLEVGQRARAPLLRQADQHEEDLRSCLRVRQRAVARRRRRAEEVRERGEARSRDAAGEQAPRERDRVDGRSLDPATREALELAVQ